MIPQEKVDAALDEVLRASGSALKYYTMPSTLKGMREAMNKIMTTSYSEGSGDNSQALKWAQEVESLRYSGQGLPGEPVDAPSLEGRMKQEASL